MKALILRFLRVPAEPHAPAGSPASIRVFRAGRNFYRYQLFFWLIKQLGAAVIIVLVLSIPMPWSGLKPPPTLGDVPHQYRLALAAWGKKRPGPERPPSEPEGGRRKRRELTEAEVQERFEPMLRIAGALFPFFEGLGIAFLIAQMPLTWLLVRLDYEMRWYIVTDRSLRIREGLTRVREMTLTFANIQNVTVEQGPMQQLLGLSDVKVRTAGGGAGGEESSRKAGHEDSMHVGYLRGVDNAEEVRDTILTRLRLLRGAGLGDPDEAADERPRAGSADAARLLLAEVRALRARLESAST